MVVVTIYSVPTIRLLSIDRDCVLILPPSISPFISFLKKRFSITECFSVVTTVSGVFT